MPMCWSRILAPLLIASATSAFAPTGSTTTALHRFRTVHPNPTGKPHTPILFSSPDDDRLDEKFGGYTVKQRLREEVESPFRKIRFFFFAGSGASASIALYFSILSLVKANMGGYEDAMPMEEALQSFGINLVAVVGCGVLAYRDYQAGESNLKRIAKGGALARLVVNPAGEERKRETLADYRRGYRVVIAAGGREYIAELARSLCSDQLADENTLPAMIAEVEVIVVPVLLEGSDGTVGDTKSAWVNTVGRPEVDNNFDIERANDIVKFPVGNGAWGEYLESELETARTQGFDVLAKGITITVKKNGKILRRATGQPQWGGFIQAMEVMDGSKFGMPGDSEKYGGP